MYSVLFHVSGIAILEICFYFYYIGPMETVIFTDKVERLAKEPVDMIEPPTTAIPTLPPNIINSIPFLSDNNNNNNNLVSNEFAINSDNNTVASEENDILDSLRKEKDDAIDKRREKNDKLFVKIIEYWIAMVFSSFLVFFIMKNYKEYKKLEKRNGIVDVPSREFDEESLELVDLNSYRRSSIDDEHLEANVKQNSKCVKYLKKALHYLFFGGCIITFQYFFFQKIVLVYDPLSIEEVKYIVYSELYPKLEKWREILVF